MTSSNDEGLDLIGIDLTTGEYMSQYKRQNHSGGTDQHITPFVVHRIYAYWIEVYEEKEYVTLKLFGGNHK